MGLWGTVTVGISGPAFKLFNGAESRCFRIGSRAWWIRRYCILCVILWSHIAALKGPGNSLRKHASVQLGKRQCAHRKLYCLCDSSLIHEHVGQVKQAGRAKVFSPVWMKDRNAAAPMHIHTRHWTHHCSLILLYLYVDPLFYNTHSSFIFADNFDNCHWSDVSWHTVHWALLHMGLHSRRSNLSVRRPSPILDTSTLCNSKRDSLDQATFFHCRVKLQYLYAHCRHFWRWIGDNMGTMAGLWLCSPIRSRAWCTVCHVTLLPWSSSKFSAICATIPLLLACTRWDEPHSHLASTSPGPPTPCQQFAVFPSSDHSQ